MATTRSRRGSREASDRRHVGLTLPRAVKEEALAAAGALEWSLGDWVLAAAAEHGGRLHEARSQAPSPERRASVPDATFAALYLTAEERAELDETAVACDMNRSAFVTAVARLGLGAALEEVVTREESGTGERPARAVAGNGGEDDRGSGSPRTWEPTPPEFT